MFQEKEIEEMRHAWRDKKYFTDAELCAMFQVSPQTTARWRKQRKIGFWRTSSGTIRYTKAHVEEFERRFEQRAAAS